MVGSPGNQPPTLGPRGILEIISFTRQKTSLWLSSLWKFQGFRTSVPEIRKIKSILIIKYNIRGREVSVVPHWRNLLEICTLGCWETVLQGETLLSYKTTQGRVVPVRTTDWWVLEKYVFSRSLWLENLPAVQELGPGEAYLAAREAKCVCAAGCTGDAGHWGGWLPVL